MGQRAGGGPLAPARPEETPRGAVIGEVLVTADNASHVLAAWGRHRRAAPRAELPHVRARLLTALAWAAGAFAVLAALSSELARVLGSSLARPGVSAAALCALLAGVGFLAALRVARKLDAHERTEAQLLLGGTTVVGAVLGCILAVVFAAGGAADLIPLAVLNVAGSAVAALVIAVVVPARPLRAMAFSSIILGPTVVLAPKLWWVGVVSALVLIAAVEVVLQHARQLALAPGPVLAACLVAFPVLVVCLSVRLALGAARALLHPGPGLGTDAEHR